MNSAKKRILLVEDDEEFVRLFTDMLGDVFAICSCVAPASVDIVLNQYREQRTEAVILDLHMPQVSGQEILTALRALNSELPIFLLSSDQTLSSKLAGLSAADDYLDKSMHADELIARIARVLTKRENPQRLAGLEFRLATFSVFHNGQELPLTRTEYALLYALAAAYPGMATRDALLAAAWPGRAADEKTLNTHIYNLKKKLQEKVGITLETDYSVGYWLVGCGPITDLKD